MTAPTPPRVDCDLTPLQPLPPIPPLAEMDEWAAQVIGIFEAEGVKRAGNRNCMAALRAKGVIQ